MCELLDVSRSGFYAYFDREESERSARDRTLLVLIRAIFEESEGRYGSPRVYRELRAAGEHVAKKRVERLMREAGLRAREKKAFRRTTDSNHGEPIARNLLERRFVVAAPNVAWVGDTTYIQTTTGWLYLVVILDLFSRRVVGWSMGARLDGKLACTALESALSNREMHAPFIFHSDRGIEFACKPFRQMISGAGGIQSMSRTGNCRDNAPAESFFSTLKIELIYREKLNSREKIEIAVFQFIEAFYNRRRRHSTLGYVSPVEFEQSFLKTAVH
jgi:putative transposase